MFCFWQKTWCWVLSAKIPNCIHSNFKWYVFRYGNDPSLRIVCVAWNYLARFLLETGHQWQHRLVWFHGQHLERGCFCQNNEDLQKQGPSKRKRCCCWGCLLFLSLACTQKAQGYDPQCFQSSFWCPQETLQGSWCQFWTYDWWEGEETYFLQCLFCRTSK